MSPEAAIEQATNRVDRKRRGQFFTPPDVANAMVDWLCQIKPRTFLDPAVGPGVFLTRLARFKPTQIVCYDVDAAAIKVARTRILPLLTQAGDFHTADFLTADIPERFDAIVANPPYIRHHEAKISDGVWRWFDEQFGMRLDRRTNIYALFLLKIMSLLSPRGRAAVITPSEFLNADFGVTVKRLLLANPAYRGFIAFDYTHNLFDGVLTTACISVFDAVKARDEITLIHAADTERLSVCFNSFAANTRAAKSESELFSTTTQITHHKRAILDPTAKWTTLAANPHTDCVNPLSEIRNPKSSLRPLSDFARCMRGIATGANAFFTLTADEARRWKIPDDVLRPCLTKSHQAPSPIFLTADFDRLRAAGKKVWLLDLTPDTAPRAAAYLAHGESLGIHQRYLTRHRKPWYLCERRDPADIWVTVFGRGRLRFVHNAAGILSLTAFHAIYLHPPYRRCLAALMDYFHSDAFTAEAARQHRVYGDGLLKFEPRDVLRLRVPDLDRTD